MQQKKGTKDDLMLYWKRFLAGNDDAFSKIYEKLVRDLFSFGTILTADCELVKDCIQDIFIRIYQNRVQLVTVENVKVYLLVALKNSLIDVFKKQQVYKKFIDLYDIDEPIDDPEEERIIARESDVALHNLMTKYQSALTKRQQEIIHYRFVDELTIEEISNLLDINYQSVANTIQRSIKKMRNLYLKREYKK